MADERDLRILQIGKYYAPHKGGIETLLQAFCEQAQRLVQLEVVVANSGRRRLVETVRGIEITRVGTLVNLASAPICPELVGVFRRTTADIIHFHFPHPAAVLAYLASGHQGRIVISYHGDITRQKVLGQVFQPFLQRILRRASALISASPNYIESSPYLSQHRERCWVIPYGIALERFQRLATDRVKEIRAQYGDRLLLSVGRLVSYKGFEYLVRAMAQIQGRLLLIGNGPLRASLEAEARRVGAAERIIFLGEVEDHVPYYQAADLFVLPSVTRAEGFGIVQLEAMACGKPVINTNLASGVPFVSPDGVTGLTVAPADTAALAAAINRLLADPLLRAQYGQAARARVAAEFSIELMTRRTLELYQEVMRAPVGDWSRSRATPALATGREVLE